MSENNKSQTFKGYKTKTFKIGLDANYTAKLKDEFKEYIDGDYVHITGDEFIEGVKTFKNDIFIEDDKVAVQSWVTNTVYDKSEIDSTIENVNTSISLINTNINDINNELENKVPLDTEGKIPSTYLPGYVDDVIEVDNLTELKKLEGVAGKIYVTIDDNKTYRWSGTGYVEISASLALGETSSTAYRGDLGVKNTRDIENLTTTINNTNKNIADNYYTKNDIDTSLTDINDNLNTNYYTKTNVDAIVTEINDNLDETINNLSEDYYTKDEVHNKQEINSIVDNINTNINNIDKNLSDNYYTIDDVDEIKENIDNTIEQIKDEIPEELSIIVREDISEDTVNTLRELELNGVKWKVPSNDNVVNLDSDQTISGVKTFGTIKVKHPDKTNFFQISPDSNGYNVKFNFANNTLMMLHNGGITNYRDILPDTNGTRNLGSTSALFKNVYVSGSLSDGTNSITVAQIVNMLSTLTREQLVSIIGEVTTSLSGLMTAQDKTNLNTLVSLLSTEEDENVVVDRINEVLAIFNQYPEGADLVSALANKADKSEIVDLTTSQTITSDKTIAYGNKTNYTIKNGNTFGIGGNQYNYLQIDYNGAGMYSFGTQQFFPNSHNSRDLGTNTLMWRNLYLIGNLTDGTNSVTIAQIVDTESNQTISGVKTFSMGPVLQNEKYLKVQDSSGTVFQILGADAANKIQFGHSGMGNIAILNTVRPDGTVAGTVDLGTSNQRWKNLYLIGELNLTNSEATNASWSITQDKYSQLNVGRTYNGTFETMFSFNGRNFLPYSNNTGDLGSTNKQWRNLYLSGNLTDGTNSITVAQIVDKLNNINLSREQLVSTIGEATTTLSGLMSTQDRTNLDTIMSVLSNEEDINTVVDKIHEVVSVFDQYPEGTTILSALADKADKSTVVTLADAQNITGAKSFSQSITRGPKVVEGYVDIGSNSTPFDRGYITYLKAPISMVTFKPQYDNNIDLGTSDRRWKDLYLSGKLYIGEDYIYNNGDYSFTFNIHGIDRFQIFQNSLKPVTDMSFHFGSKTQRLGDIYLGGVLTDGTNSINIASIANKNDIPTDYVDLTSDQEIDGVKTFNERPLVKVLGTKLPEEYQEVNYIESSGTQYIDTGVNLGVDNFDIECDFTQTQRTSGEQHICSIWTSTYRYWTIFINSAGKLDLYTNGHNYHESTVSVGIKNKMCITRSGSSWKINFNNVINSFTYSPTTTNPTTLKLFIQGDLGEPNTHIQMYMFKLVQNGTIVRHYIPCYRKSDNVIGMYDIVSDNFFINQGTGTFLKGDDVITSDAESYVNVATVNDIPTNYVDIESEQSVNGIKDFNDGIAIGGLKVLKDSSDRIAFYFNDNPKVKIGFLDTLFANRITPDASNTYDMGRSGVYWRDLYLAGNLTDGTNSINIASIANKNDIPTDYVDLTSDQEIDGVKTFNERPLVKVLGTKLPKEYQEVNYIESTGTQYIDTDFIPSSYGNVMAEVEYLYTSLPGEPNPYAYVLGVRGTSTNRFDLIGSDRAVQYTRIGTVKSISASINVNTNEKYTQIVDVKSHTLTVNGTSYEMTYESPTTVQSPLRLFSTSQNDGSGSQWNMSGRIWYCRLYDNGILVRDLIPCYRKSDNVIGMYDIVSDNFFINQGTGTFLKGDDVITSDAESYVNVATVNDIPDSYTKEESDAKYLPTVSFTYNGPNSETVESLYNKIIKDAPSGQCFLKITGYIEFSGYINIKYAGGYIIDLMDFGKKKCVSNYYSSTDYFDTVYHELKELVLAEDFKTINGESIVGSGDIVIQGGETRPLKEYVQAGVTEKQLEPNKYYIFDSQVASNITITLAEEDDTYLDEFMGEIKVDETAINITFPNIIRWNDNSNVTNTEGVLTLEAKNTYLFSVANSLGLITNIPNPSLAEAVYTINGSVVSWEEVANATSYDVYNGDILLVENTTLTSIDMSAYLTEPGEYTLKIIAKSNYYVDSNVAINYIKTKQLSTPVLLGISYSCITGSVIPSIMFTLQLDEDRTSCLITLDGVEKTSTANTAYPTYNLDSELTEGEHTVSFKVTNTEFPNIYLDSESSSYTINLLPSMTMLTDSGQTLNPSSIIEWQNNNPEIEIVGYHIDVVLSGNTTGGKGFTITNSYVSVEEINSHFSLTEGSSYDVKIQRAFGSYSLNFENTENCPFLTFTYSETTE